MPPHHVDATHLVQAFVAVLDHLVVVTVALQLPPFDMVEYTAASLDRAGAKFVAHVANAEPPDDGAEEHHHQIDSDQLAKHRPEPRLPCLPFPVRSLTHESLLEQC